MFECTGFYKEVDSIATWLVVGLLNLKHVSSPEALLNTDPNIIMIHSLDLDVPK